MSDAGFLTAIHLHGPLADKFGPVHNRWVHSPMEGMRALCMQKKGFKEMLSAPGASYAILIGKTEVPFEGLFLNHSGEEVHVVPIVEGNKDEFTQIIVGVIIAVAAFYFTGPAGSSAAWASTTAATVGNMVGSMGMAMAFGGVARLLAEPPPGIKPQEADKNTPSSVFSGPVNTTSQGHPVQICYGEVRVGSAVISTLVDNSDDLTGGYSGECGFDNGTMVTLQGGGTTQIATLSGSSFVQTFMDDDTTGYSQPYRIDSNFGTGYTITFVGGGSIVLSNYNSLVMSDGGTKTAEAIAPGDTLSNGKVVESSERGARISLTDLYFFSNMTYDERGNLQGGPDPAYYLVNGIKTCCNVEYPTWNGGDGPYN